MQRVLKDNTFINETHVRCWSCDEVMELKDCNNNDGHCIECDVEMDLSDEPYTKD